MTNPTLSIVLYCYNRTKWLDECLASLITQDLAACEVVIVDSSTSDAVEAWFADRAPLTTPFRHFRNRK